MLNNNSWLPVLWTMFTVVSRLTLVRFQSEFTSYIGGGGRGGGYIFVRKSYTNIIGHPKSTRSVIALNYGITG